MKQLLIRILALLLLLCFSQQAAAAKVRISFSDWAGPPLDVFISRPTALAADRPVVFVMHGTNRNADEYRDQWHGLANQHEFLLVVPEFSDRDFPGAESYNYGNVLDRDGATRDRSEWTFEAIEKIFDDVVHRFSMNATTYAIYGHSAGAQFVHRFILHMPEARVSRIVVANAGWYTMPDTQVEFPYGLGNSAISRDTLAAVLQLPVTILLGEEDTDPDHEFLRRTPEAMEQGDHRYARGNSFYNAARKTAGELGVKFNWELATVPGVGHDNQLMAPAAVDYLLD